MSNYAVDTLKITSLMYGDCGELNTVVVELQVNEFPKPNTNQPGYGFETMAGGKVRMRAYAVRGRDNHA